VAIELRLKDLARLSDARQFEMAAFYRKQEAALALVQRRGHKRRATAPHAKARNCRTHVLHQGSTRLVRAQAGVIVGDVTTAALAQTRMAKCVFDAG
jgi:hypothetical protein